MVGKPILVVEDDQQIAATLRLVLRSWSWDAENAFTLAEGIGKVTSGQFGHLILDLMLPDGDGADVLREIRRRGIDVKVVVTSAIADDRRDELVGLGAHRVLTKPYSLVALSDALAS